MSEDDVTVLVVDDEPRFVEAHRRWLTDHYDVRTADDGTEALDEVDETVDVVLLDRRMPKLSGLDVLSEIRERGLDCVVVVVSSVKPDIDIIQEQFDDYLVKPTDQETLLGLIDSWIDVRGHDKRREYRALESKRELLETHENEQRLADDDTYDSLVDRLDTLQESVSIPDDNG